MTEPSPTTKPASPPAKSSRPSVVLCPYCGAVTPKAARCGRCRGLLDPLSRQATQNAMGPWFVRDVNNPHRPGCSYHTLKDMASKGRLHPETILRGPTTNQFWSLAKRTPGVSHLIGLCYACQEEVEPTDVMCRFCGVSFEVEADRQHLGLAPVHLLPGQAPAEAIAESSDVLSPSFDSTTDSSSATIGKVPGSEIAALDDTDRLVRRLAGKIKRQRIVTALVLLIALAALAAVGMLIAEARGLMPRTLTPLLLTPPAEPSRPPPGPGPASPGTPVTPSQPIDSPPDAQPAPAADPSLHGSPASPTPVSQPEPAPAAIPAQNPADQALAPIRDLIAKDTQASLQEALTQLADLKKQRPSLAEACRNLERLATQRLEQLRLKRLP